MWSRASYPYMVREFQKVIGIEARAQVLERYGACRPTSSLASAAAATRWHLRRFVDDAAVKLWGVEASGTHCLDRYRRVDQRGFDRHLAGLALVRAADTEGQVRERTRSARASH